MNVKNSLHDYIAESFFGDGQTAILDDDANLMELLDSLQILRIVTDVEKQFSIHVGNDDLIPENFGSVEQLAAFVTRRQQAPAEARLHA